MDKIYFKPQTGYTGVQPLLRKAKIENPKVTQVAVQKWLSKEPTYTLHKPIRKKFIRNKVVVSYIDEQWQIDLADMQSLSKFNDGYKYLLNCIDVFSKFAWSIPTKNKTGKAILEAFKTILESKRRPDKLQADAGTEFTNKEFQKFLKSEEIHFFTTRSEVKASIVERFNRTLKERMWRWFTRNHSHRYIDILPDLVHNYNYSYHRTIKTFPANVTIENEKDIYEKAFAPKTPKKPAKFKFNIGDTVRISKAKRMFEKGYQAGWTEEIFTVFNRIARQPPVYVLADTLGEVLEGIFYAEELQKVIHTDSLYVVEKVIRTRKKGKKTEYFVKWRGYPAKFNSWVSELTKL